MANVARSRDSIHSFLTVVDHENASKPRPYSFIDTELEKEVTREEKCMETYGGDDPHDPSVNKSGTGPAEESDILKVGWDGPDDPENPQNWSKSYKWLITIVCCLLTINVYVPTLNLDEGG